MGSGEQSGHLNRCEEGDRLAQIALAWHGEDALRQGAMLRCMQGHIAEEGMDRCETDVATAGAIFASLLEVIEERAEKSGVEIRQHQVGRRFASLSLCILEQQTKRIS